MIDYSKELKQQLDEIERLILRVKRGQKAFEGLPEGSIRVSMSGGRPIYLLARQDTLKTEYISSKNKELIYKMVQQEYETKALRELEEMEKRLSTFLDKYNAKSLENLYSSLCEGRKKLVEPLVLSDEAYIQKWLEEHQGEQNPFPEKGIYETEQGEFVRSKSEKIIADTLFKMKVPYRYETRLELDGNRDAYPDFACLNVRLRETKYWEHLGLLGNGDYENKNFEKIVTYERNGILIGEDLILSFETREHPLRTVDIRRKIEKFLL